MRRLHGFAYILWTWSGLFTSSINARGIVRTVAGGGDPHNGGVSDCFESAQGMDGIGSDARFNYPWAIEWDPTENMIYVGDCSCPESPHSNDRIRRINPNTGMAIDTRKRVMYLADVGNSRIRKVDMATAEVTTFAGNGSEGLVDGERTRAQFKGPQSLSLDDEGDRLFVGDTDNHAIRVISLKDGSVQTLVGGSLGFKDGVGLNSKFYHPTGIAYDKENDILYVSDHYNHVIRAVKVSERVVTTLAGTGREGLKDGQGDQAAFNYPEGLEYDSDHRVLYLAEFANHAVRMITTQGHVTTLAGGRASGRQDGVGSDAKFFHPTRLTFDHKRKVIYVTDQYNHMIRSISGLGNKDWPARVQELRANFSENALLVFVFCAVVLALIVLSRPYWRRRLRTRMV
ncbi:NHL repeat-containing protein 2 isoform X2 [Nematostella vectensis]|uniref:NHL repeat-containing protein 2 isoform X2 n=1 Tax=Nematostella vectensis TaxID=45351 RepID=UPI00207732F4|nr:NHL repeat-containing protein 2 isoform X2 [Nematostella vectensis]